MEELIWHTEKRKINDLIPYEGNPRMMTEKQKNDLEESLKRFNLMSIPVVNVGNVVVSGHQRLKILQSLGRGEEEIDVRISNRKLTSEEVREANLRENKNLGSWDYDLLSNVDEKMLLGVGFTREELLENFSLNEAERVLFEENRFEVIVVEAPEAARLKARHVFYCDSVEEFERIKGYFRTDREGCLDKAKLVGLMKDDKVF